MGNGVKQLLEFGPFRLDSEQRLLFRDQQAIPLPSKTFDLLLVLVQHSGQVVLKDDLMKTLWPDTFVEESNLGQHVFQLRKALGDQSQNSAYIVTVPGRGYRFAQGVNILRPEDEFLVETHTRTHLVVEESGARVKALPAKSNRLLGYFFSAVILAIIAATAFHSYFRGTPELTDKDTVVLADFTNTTGDPVFDDALRQGLSAQLEQSPFLNLLSDQRIAQTLALMIKPKDSRLTHELAREVCQRTASAATIEGSIASLGSQYVLGLKALNCDNGDVLAHEQMTASGKERVLKALGEGATKLRERLGESLASVQKFGVPSDSVTTASLDALQAYSLGYRAHVVKNDCGAGITLYQRAISLDPNFAMAYARLGTCDYNTGQHEHAAENTRKAYELRDRVSEREKLYIVSHYENLVTGNLEAARQAYELWSQTYPRDEFPVINLGQLYGYFGDYDKALSEAREALRLDSASGVNYANLVQDYVYLNRLDEAKVTAAEARAHHLDSDWIHSLLYPIAFLQHDAAGMEREAAAMKSQAGSNGPILYIESDTAAYIGQFSKARELTRRAVGSVKRADEKEIAASYEADAALREALVGDMELARQQAQAALALSHGRDVAAMAAIALGLTGDSAAKNLVEDLNRRFPEDTIVQTEYLPMIHAAIALEAGDGTKAAESLAATDAYELGNGPIMWGMWGFALYPVYLRGEAHLASHHAAAATSEFQKIFDHPGVVGNELIGALAHLQLGRAYALSANVKKAGLEYQRFFSLWKDADPDIPILKQARAEYAKLQ